jgi:hypothetical protein
MFMSMDESLLN